MPIVLFLKSWIFFGGGEGKRFNFQDIFLFPEEKKKR